MPRIESYKPGSPSWVDLWTRDLDAAEAFYASLFGWEFERMPVNEDGTMVYSMARVGDKYAAGLSEQRATEAGPGTPCVWSGYITVQDVDATSAAVPGCGGTVAMEPFDVFDAGRMAAVKDATGALIHFWQPNQHIGSEVRDEHGAFAWLELLTRDPAAAERFYVDLLGVEAKTDKLGDGPDYTMLIVDGKGVAGIMAMPQHLVNTDVPNHWEAYFRVERPGRDGCEAPLGRRAHAGRSDADRGRGADRRRGRSAGCRVRPRLLLTRRVRDSGERSPGPAGAGPGASVAQFSAASVMACVQAPSGGREITGSEPPARRVATVRS